MKIYNTIKHNPFGLYVAVGRLILTDPTKPLIISEIEEIEEGDWIIVNEVSNGVIQSYGTEIKIAKSDYAVAPYVQKVIALPEHFSKKTRGLISDNIFKNNDKVLLACTTHDEWFKENPPFSAPYTDEVYYQVDFNSKSEITVFNVEKVFTAEDVLSFGNFIYLMPTDEFEYWVHQGNTIDLLNKWLDKRKK